MRKVPKCSLVSTRIAVTSREGTAPCSLTCDFAFFAPFPEAASGAQGPCYSGPPVLSGPWRCARGLGAMASYKNCASMKTFKLVLNIIIETAQNTEIDQYGYLMYACRPGAGAVTRQRRCTATVFAWVHCRVSLKSFQLSKSSPAILLYSRFGSRYWKISGIVVVR